MMNNRIKAYQGMVQIPVIGEWVKNMPAYKEGFILSFLFKFGRLSKVDFECEIQRVELDLERIGGGDNGDLLRILRWINNNHEVESGE